MNEYRWADLHVGLRHQFNVELTAQMMTSFAGISGDVNPLHTNAEYARCQGFQDKVAFGLLLASFYSQLVGVYLPGKFALLHGIDVEFQKPAFVGDRLRVLGEVTYLNEAYHRIELRASIENERAEVLSKAKVRVGLLGG